MIEAAVTMVISVIASVACFWISKRQRAKAADAAEDTRRFKGNVTRQAICRGEHMTLCEGVFVLRAAGILFCIFALVAICKILPSIVAGGPK